jgi:hypothetical protein
MIEKNHRLWKDIVSRVMNEYHCLTPRELTWINTRLDQIEALQLELNQLFCHAEGAAICHQCQGDCCAKGHNHVTLANLLSFIRRGDLPPEADFTSTCPFLSGEGCRLSVTSRPYNCITFICDRIEDALPQDKKNHFYALDTELRSLYLEFSQRYRGAAMTGVLIFEQRRPGQSFLASNCQ